MKTLLLLGVALAAGAPVAAGAQAPSHSHPAPREAGAAPAKPGAVPARSQAARPAPDATGYRSAFSDYRRFEAEPPAKGWREANDEVRDVGGHAGVVQGTRGQAEAHPGAKP